MHAFASRRPDFSAHWQRRSLLTLSVVALMAFVGTAVVFAARPFPVSAAMTLPQGPATAMAPLVVEAVKATAPTLEAGSTEPDAMRTKRSHTRHKPIRRSRHTVAMPYFSFARN